VALKGARGKQFYRGRGEQRRTLNQSPRGKAFIPAHFLAEDSGVEIPVVGMAFGSGIKAAVKVEAEPTDESQGRKNVH